MMNTIFKRTAAQRAAFKPSTSRNFTVALTQRME